MAETWLKCSACRTEIAFGVRHWVCSVSTCNRNRMRLVFCSVACWDSHLSTVRHRDAGAIEAWAPSKEAWAREVAAEGGAPTSSARPTPAPGVAVRPMPAPVARPAPIASAEGSQPVRSGPAPTSDSYQPGLTRSSPSPSPAPAQVAQPAPIRRVVGEASPTTAAAVEGVKLSDAVERDMLIVISKLKKYIKDRSGMNCSDAIAEGLSDHVRVLCDDAIRSAARDERKTVLDRDIPKSRR